MGGALDALMKSVAGSLVDTFGTTATLITPGTTTVNETTGEVTEGAETTQTVKCSPPNAYSVRQIDGTRIMQGDLKIIIPTTSYASEPTTAQKVQIRNREYQIINVTPYSSGNSEAAWELQIRS